MNLQGEQEKQLERSPRSPKPPRVLGPLPSCTRSISIVHASASHTSSFRERWKGEKKIFLHWGGGLVIRADVCLSWNWEYNDWIKIVFSLDPRHPYLGRTLKSSGLVIQYPSRWGKATFLIKKGISQDLLIHSNWTYSRDSCRTLSSDWGFWNPLPLRQWECDEYTNGDSKIRSQNRSSFVRMLNPLEKEW